MPARGLYAAKRCFAIQAFVSPTENDFVGLTPLISLFSILTIPHQAARWALLNADRTGQDLLQVGEAPCDGSPGGGQKAEKP